MVDFAGNHVVVTGGTGALGRAVIGALRAGNAICHVPNLVAAELDGFPYATDPGVHIALDVDLADEAAVKRFYQALPPLWASIHLAGGFAMAPIGDTSAEDFIAQFRMNALSCFLCSAAAVACPAGACPPASERCRPAYRTPSCCWRGPLPRAS